MFVKGQKMSWTTRQEDLGFTEEIRPFEVHCITDLLGYGDASLGNQHPNTLKECTAFNFRGLQFSLWAWRRGYVCQPVTQYHMAKEHNPQPVLWNPQNCNYLPLQSPASHFQHFWIFVVVIWTYSIMYTGQHRKNVNIHPHPKWNSNPWFQCFSSTEKYVPYAKKPLWSAQ